jgi:hypothetical protein
MKWCLMNDTLFLCTPVLVAHTPSAKKKSFNATLNTHFHEITILIPFALTTQDRPWWRLRRTCGTSASQPNFLSHSCHPSTRHNPLQYATSRSPASATALGPCATRAVVQSPPQNLCNCVGHIAVRHSIPAHVLLLMPPQTLRCYRHWRRPRRLRSLSRSSSIRRTNSPHNAQTRQPRRMLV